MRFMVLVKANAGSEAGVMPTRAQREAMAGFNERLFNAGVLLGGDGLHPSSRGVRVTLQAGRAAVVDGPFAETHELVAGFWLWQARSLEEAIEWARRIPHAADAPVVVEIRQVLDAGDCRDASTTDLPGREDGIGDRPRRTS